MGDIRRTTLKDIVLEDFRAAAVFERHSLDFCCGGRKTIVEACVGKDLDPEMIVAELTNLESRDRPVGDKFASMPLDQLIEHIIAQHHGYVRGASPVILAHTTKLATVHGANHPEVIRIAALARSVADEMQTHMIKEEKVLFPHIQRLVNARRTGEETIPPHFGTIRNPIMMMEAEHRSAGDALYEIRALSSAYAPPADACTTYRVAYQELEEFEKDLHEHVHLENNILFPNAIALEEELSQDYMRAQGD